MRLASNTIACKACVIAASFVLMSACMKSPAEQYAAYMESGASYVEEGDHSSAALEFRNAARVNPNEAEPQYQLAKTYLAMGRLEECYRAVREAVEIDPQHTDATLLMAQILARLGNSEEVREAEGLLEGVLESRPDDVDALFTMAVAQVRLGSAEEAASILQQAIEKAPGHLQSAVALARVRMSEGDNEAAEQILRQAVAEAEDDRPARLALVQFLTTVGRIDEAVAESDAVIEEHSEYSPGLMARGLLHLRAQEPDAAEALYKRAIEAPDAPDKTVYGRLLAGNGKSEEAVAEFRRLLDEDPSNRDVRTLMLRAMLLHGDIDAANEVLSSAINDNERDFQARVQRAVLYLRNGLLEDARSDVEAALEVQPTSAQAHYILAKVHQGAQNPTGARQELGEALRLQSSFLLARLDMAQSLLRSVSKRSALDVLDEAPEEQRNHPRLLSGRIWALIALGDYADALAEIERVREEVGALRDLQLQEGVIYAAQGNHAEALPRLQASLEENPADLRALNALVASQISSGQLERGIASATGHADAYPGNGALQLASGSWLLRAGKAQEARSYLERASEAGDPTHEAEILIARLDEAGGDSDAAMARLQGVIDKQSNHVGALIRLATIQERQSLYDEAERNYREALFTAPEQVSALNNLAYLIATRGGNLDEALTLAQRAREHTPDGFARTAMVEDTLGWVHYLRGSYPTAVLNLQAAADRAPNQAVILYHLAMAQAKNGNGAAAKEAYEAAMAIDPELPEAAEAAGLIQ